MTGDRDDDLPVAPIDRRAAFRFWLKLGCIGFGGPAGQIAILHRELVTERRWISEQRFLHALNYCMLLPGPEAQQLATYLGWLMHRTYGGIVAGVLFVLPALLLLVLLSWAYLVFGHLPMLASVFATVKPAVVAIVLAAGWRLGGRVLRQGAWWILAVLAFVAVGMLHWPFPWIVLAALATGAFIAWRRPGWLPAAAHAAGARTDAPALIDDHTPIPEHARFRWVRFWRVLALGLIAWAVPMAGLVALYGMAHPYPQMAWFFTKAALLTFGGAYAVLPYVMQGAVQQHQWLSSGQMIDGLALGETTPGPLIMVVVFIAYLGGHQAALFGPEPAQQFAAGAFAAAITTWFTFLPSFVFILAGGPIVESTRGLQGVQGPLTAVTAAVVGVIVALALEFGRIVFLPTGMPDWTAIAIAAAAAVAMIGFRRSVLEVVIGAAVVGVVRGLPSVWR